MFIRHYLLASAVVASGLLFTGCTSESNLSSPTSPVATNLHGHPSHGPHHGELVELGDEEYHAELLHDAASVTIYILNGSADQQVAIDTTEITINTLHEGQPEQFSLAASPDTNDSQGKSSRFVSNDANLAARLDEEGAKHRLTLTIEGKSYRGEIAHDHDHSGHDHKGGDHDHEDHEDHDGHDHDEKDHGHE